MKPSLARLLAAAARLSDGRFTVLAAVSIIATSAVVGTAYGNSFNPALTKALERLFASAGGTAAAASPSASAGDTSLPSIPPAPPSKPLAPQAPPQTSQTVTTTTQPPPPATTSTPTQTTPTTPPPPTTPPLPTTPVKHVFLISLASPGYDAAFGNETTGVAAQMPYLANKLRPKGELLTGYSLLGQGDLPNYIAMTSGQPPNPDTKADCPKYLEFKGGAAPDPNTGIVKGTGCVYPNTALTIGDQLTVAGDSWRAYIEGMGDANGPGSCIHPDSGAPDQTIANSPDGLYTETHNPFVFYHSLLDLGSCFNSDVPADQLTTDLKKESTTPNFSFISPGLCNSGALATCPDGSPGGAATEDAYLASTVPQIMKSPAYRKDGMLIVTFGEPSPTDTTKKGPAGLLVVSKFVAPGGTLVESYNPYSVLASLEDFFGLTHLAMANASTTSSFATSVLGAGD